MSDLEHESVTPRLEPEIAGLLETNLALVATPHTWLDCVEFCLQHRNLLNRWQQGFLLNVQSYYSSLSPKQLICVERTTAEVQRKLQIAASK